MRLLLLAFVASVVAGCRCEPPPRRDIPTFHAPRLSPTIDGDLSEWSAVPETAPFVDTMTGGGALGRSTGRFSWDDAALYVAFSIEDGFLASSFTAHDEHLWEADCAELMIDRGSDGEDYVELQISPSNVVFDTWFDTYRAPQPVGHLDWSSELRSAVALRGTPNDDAHDSGYDVEIAIPWETLTRVGDPAGAAPAAGEEWRVALYVLDLLDAGATASAWSAPLVGDFHVPDRFGRVILDP
jgi:hypothetical protein